MKLQGHSALVTGGASGLGAATARALARAGAKVALLDVNADAAATFAREIGGIALRCDVADAASAEAAVAEAARAHGPARVLVNCAGITRFVRHTDLEALDDELIDNILATNVRGAFALVRAFRPMLEQSPLPGGGVVVNLSSAAGTLAMGSNVIYCASKAALDNMTKSLARSLAPVIRVISVSPALVDTEFVKAMDPGWHDEQVARTPLGRLATPEEVATAVVTAITTLTFATGSIFLVDGGRSLA